MTNQIMGGDGGTRIDGDQDEAVVFAGLREWLTIRTPFSGAAVMRSTISQGYAEDYPGFIARWPAEPALMLAARTLRSRCSACTVEITSPFTYGTIIRDGITDNYSETIIPRQLLQDNYSKTSVPTLCCWFAKRTAMELCSHSENYVFETCKARPARDDACVAHRVVGCADVPFF